MKINGNALRCQATYLLWEERKSDIEHFTQLEWSQQRIADYYGVSQTWISKVMLRLHIEARDKANSGARNGRYIDGSESRIYRKLVVLDKCPFCGSTERLVVHHKDGNHLNNDLDNLQVLCHICHAIITAFDAWDKREPCNVGSKRLPPSRNSKMQAYVAYFEDEDWVCLIHGETRGKAKANFMHWNPGNNDPNDYPLVHLHRIPGLDDKPFTFENAKQAGFMYQEEGEEEPSPSDFINDCQCEVCQAPKRLISLG